MQNGLSCFGDELARLAQGSCDYFGGRQDFEKKGQPDGCHIN